MGKLALKGQKLYLASLCFCPCRASFLRNASTQGDALGYELMAFQAVSPVSQFGRICNPTVRSMGICKPKTHEKDISFYCSPEKSAEGDYLADTNNNK